MYTDKNGTVWYKGNLHTHTTRSDGRKTPEEVIKLYRDNGYDFLSLTDHWKYSDNGVTEDGMLLLAGCEYNTGHTPAPDDGIFHIISTGADAEPDIIGCMKPQQIIDEIRRAGGLVTLAHPAWSLNRPEALDTLTGVEAIEIFNSVSNLPPNCRPYSGLFADTVAAAGKYPLLTAVDDTHFYRGDECRSFVMVKAAALDRESVLEAIRAGRFYSTQGPAISLVRDGKYVVAETSEVARITFFSDSCWVGERVFFPRDGEPLTRAEYKPPCTDTFVRAEAVDSEGRTAWSNFLVL